jgi:integrase
MTDEIKVPKVRIAKPTGRPIQLRYTDPETKKEIRITTETYDPIVADDLKAKLEAKLLLGIDAKPKRRKGGATMDWQEFRDRYIELKLESLRAGSAVSAESRLDIAERILKPRTLADVVNSEALHTLQAKLLAGAEGKSGKRSKHTVKNYMATVLAALNWGCTMGWLASVPRIDKVKCSKLRHAKGRGINDKEFKAVLGAVVGVVGEDAAPSWKYLLRGLRESGLRLDELMHVHWSDGRHIVPRWTAGTALPLLVIPAAMQKNDTEESIPLIPGFETLLLETPDSQQFGWTFNPMSLQVQHERPVKYQRPNAEWVGKVICRIGKASGVVVLADNGKGKPKHVSAHDLRRTCTERLIAAGVPERDASRILRHASTETTRRYYAPGDVQTSAETIRDCLSVPRYNESLEST